jgi:hypothetical protein
MRDGMEEEEKEIRGYFDDMTRPIKEDPTLVRMKNETSKDEETTTRR